jgi:hypothetical protein
MNELWQSNYTFQEECKKSIDIKTTYILSLEAHIAELEALQAHLTCDGCIHQYIEFDGSGCRLCENYDLECARGYCVDRYEPKGSQ